MLPLKNVQCNYTSRLKKEQFCNDRLVIFGLTKEYRQQISTYWGRTFSFQKKKLIALALDLMPFCLLL